MKDNAIIVQNLTKAYKKVEVLKGLDFTVERGTMLALLGPNGAGKTTTIKILSTLLKADSGQAIVNGFDVATDAHKVRHNIGLTGQYTAVDEYLTGKENLIMMGRLYHLGIKNSQKRANELLEQFDLAEAGERPVKTYSGGMRRRLDLALSLIATPPVLFLDEPTTGLDPRSRLALWEIVKQLVAAGVTILLTTQNLEEADHLADKIAVLDNGKIIASGTADELKNKVGKERLEIVIDDDSDFAQAESLFKNKTLKTDCKGRCISLSIENGVNEVKQILDLVEKAGIRIEAMSLHKPTLDDVFLNLTGHKTPEEEIINNKV